MINPTTTIITLDAGGGTIDLADYPYVQQFIVQSAVVTLTSSWTIQRTGTPADFEQVKIKWNGRITLDGNSITILGYPVTQEQANKSGEMTYTYDGAWRQVAVVDYGESEWLTADKIPDGEIPTAKLEDLAITTAKVADSAITPTKQSTAGKEKQMTLDVSFETGELGDGYKVYFASAAILKYVAYSVSKLIEASDNATIDITLSSGIPTGSPITIPAGSAIGTTSVAVLSGNVSVNGDSYATFETAKVTAGGKVTLTIVYENV